MFLKCVAPRPKVGLAPDNITRLEQSEDIGLVQGETRASCGSPAGTPQASRESPQEELSVRGLALVRHGPFCPVQVWSESARLVPASVLI